ncbi:MAG: BamA/TamA family outer membrane protein [Acidobacteria bacterium]|nr:BamA/TamA family outer membrane protein [Acidobacteriota bacterium]
MRSDARRAGLAPAACVAMLAATGPVSAQIDGLIGRRVVAVDFVSDGRPADDPAAAELVETRIGEPLAMRQVRESLTHLYSTGRYGGVRVEATPRPAGVALRYVLPPLALIERVRFRGQLGVPADDLELAVRQAFGAVFGVEAIDPLVGTLRRYLRRRGFFRPRIEPDVARDGAQGELRIDLDAGPRAVIERVPISGVSSPALNRRLLDRLQLRRGLPYDGAELDRRLSEYEAELRAEGFYEARLSHDVEERDGGRTVNVLLSVRRGPRVTVAFAGDAVPGGNVAELVTIEREATVNEDLLEDDGRRIAEHLRQLGYRDAAVTHARSLAGDDLSVVFTVARGPLYRLADLAFRGNEAVPTPTLEPLVGVDLGGPLVVADIERGLDAIVEHYHRLGFATADAVPVLMTVAEGDGAAPVEVACRVEIDEGERTSIRSIAFDGITAWDRAALESTVGASVGSPYYGPQVEADRLAVLTRYLNEGYEQALVTVERRFSDDLRQVDLVFRVREGRQVRVDHVLVVGNRRVTAEAVRREIPLAPGMPLGLDEIAETRRRLNALGIFRRIDIREFSHGALDRRDLIIEVEEAPATRVAYGGGLEGSQRLRRRTGAAGSRAVEDIELAPRGFFEIGRRNLFGGNRSLDFFTRASFRRKNDPADPELAQRTTTLGFNEYRVLGTYREPRTFGLGWDVLVQGFVEQAIRPGFDLSSRGGIAQFTRQVSPVLRTTAGYRFGMNDTSNEQLSREDGDIVDRLFPDVRLSTFSFGQVLDTRDNPFDPSRGGTLGIDAEVALRAAGSQVGFAKTVLQGFLYRTVAGMSRLVFAGGARLGLAWKFPHYVAGSRDDPLAELPLIDPGLPISERFFAGGDTSVRGFAFDRLGQPFDRKGGTIDRTGFPLGGHAMVVLNSELRIRLTPSVGIVTFLDAGNVYHRVQHMDLQHLRGGAGFGLRYASPIGPIRVELGFKLGERYEYGCGDREGLECLTQLHFSIGQAF